MNPGWLHHFNAAVAQLVERRSEMPGVEGSIPSRCTNSFARWQVAPERHPLTSASRTCRANRNRRPSASRGSMTPETRIWPRAESLDCRDRDPPGWPQRCGPPHPATLRDADRHGEAQCGAATGRGFGVYRTPSCETFQCRPEHLGVAVAQLAELRDVTPAVVGSNPTGHPQVFSIDASLAQWKSIRLSSGMSAVQSRYEAPSLFATETKDARFSSSVAERPAHNRSSFSK